MELLSQRGYLFERVWEILSGSPPEKLDQYFPILRGLRASVSLPQKHRSLLFFPIQYGEQNLVTNLIIVSLIPT